MEIDPEYDPAIEDLQPPDFSCRYVGVGQRLGDPGRATFGITVTTDLHQLMSGFGRLEACATSPDCGDGDGDVSDVVRDSAEVVSTHQWVYVNDEPGLYTELQSMAAAENGQECFATYLAYSDVAPDDASLSGLAARFEAFNAAACGLS